MFVCSGEGSALVKMPNFPGRKCFSYSSADRYVYTKQPKTRALTHAQTQQGQAIRQHPAPPRTTSSQPPHAELLLDGGN